MIQAKNASYPPCRCSGTRRCWKPSSISASSLCSIRRKPLRSSGKPGSAVFLYYPNNFPHIPLFASADYQGKSARGLYGDVVTELDWNVGQILQTVKELGIDENTLVILPVTMVPGCPRKKKAVRPGCCLRAKAPPTKAGCGYRPLPGGPASFNPDR